MAPLRLQHPAQRVPSVVSPPDAAVAVMTSPGCIPLYGHTNDNLIDVGSVIRSIRRLIPDPEPKQ